MQDVAKSLDSMIAMNEHEAAANPEILDEAAVRWATHSLKTYRGDLLTQALAISKALAEFTAELLQRT